MRDKPCELHLGRMIAPQGRCKFFEFTHLKFEKREDSYIMAPQTIDLSILTLTEVAKLLRCSKTHISNLVNGKVTGMPPLPHLKMGRRVLVRSDWLKSWMESCRVQ